MKWKKSVLLAAAAGAACTAVAAAQLDTLVPEGVTVRKVRLVNGELVPAGSYTARAPKTYDAQAGAACATYLGTPHIIDDVNFGPVGPWAATTNNVMRSISIPVANSQTAPTSFDLRVRIWDAADFGASPMVSTGATPLWQATLTLNNVANGIYDFEIFPNTPPTLPDSNVWVEVECFNVGTTTLKPLATATIPSLLWGLNVVTAGPGSSTGNWGRDRDNDGLLEGGPVGAPPAEHNQTALAAPCAGQFTNLAIFITGDVAAPPPAHTSLGVLADSQQRTDTITAGQVKWYSVNLSNDVTDGLLTYLDIDTVGSDIADTALALFDPSGNLVSSDQDSGPGEAAQLSFGVGRRPASGDGAQFDGYGGELLATNTYYLAVAAGATTFDDAFIAASTGAEAGSIRVNFRGNTNGSALPPSVAPIGVDMGVLLSPGAANAPTLPGDSNILWYTFNICQNVDGSNTENYLDVDFANGDPSGDADQEAFLFDSAGNVVVTSDDEGPAFFPQFSFGDASTPRGPYRASGQTFAGENGALAAGTYYLGVGFFDVRPLATATTDGRWHIRPLGGDNLAIAVDFYTGLVDCSTPCAPCAADFNQDGGVDGGDVESFFVVWQAGEACGDVNQDGGVDGGDVEGFFVVWEAGGC